MRTVVAALVVLAVGLTGATATAAIPTTKKGTAIVLGTAIGKAKLGQTRSAGEAAWGSKAKCGVPDGKLVTCVFGNPSSGQGFGQFGVVAGRVTQIWILLGSNATTNTPVKKSPLTKFKTAKGIGLGSSEKQLLKAYPKGKRFTGGPANDLTQLRVTGPRKALTIFDLQAGIVISVRVDDGVTNG